MFCDIKQPYFKRGLSQAPPRGSYATSQDWTCTIPCWLFGKRKISLELPLSFQCPFKIVSACAMLITFELKFFFWLRYPSDTQLEGKGLNGMQVSRERHFEKSRALATGRATQIFQRRPRHLMFLKTARYAIKDYLVQSHKLTRQFQNPKSRSMFWQQTRPCPLDYILMALVCIKSKYISKQLIQTRPNSRCNSCILVLYQWKLTAPPLWSPGRWLQEPRSRGENLRWLLQIGDGNLQILTVNGLWMFIDIYWIY